MTDTKSLYTASKTRTLTVAMAPIILITILLSVSCGASAVDVRCPEEGCGNLTIYLGPKWGSKVIVLSQHEEPSQEPSESQRVPPQVLAFDKTDLLPTTTTTAAPELPDIYNRWRDRFLTTTSRYWRNPWPTTTTTTTSRYWRNPWPTTTTTTTSRYWRKPTTTTTTSLTERGLGHWETLNLTYTSITGEELKTLLSQLTKNDTSKLQYLYLGHNNISDLQMFTFPLESELHLRELSLDNNPMWRLTYEARFEISRLHSLQTLNLSRCGLTFMDCPYSSSLFTLDLSYNHLEGLPDFLDRLPNLNRLLLDGNQIHYLNYFQTVPVLQVLSLSSNGLSYIGNTTFSPFQSLRNLYELRLNNNSLTDASVIKVNRYATLHLSDNPWECSCALVDFAEAKGVSVADSQKLTCISPQYGFPRLVIPHVRLEMQDVCDNTTSSWRYRLYKVFKPLKDVERWFLRRGIHVYHIMLFLLVVVTVVAVRLTLKRQKKNSKVAPAPTEVPYNILDDKMLA